MVPASENVTLPEPVSAFLSAVTADLRRKKVRRARITPLLNRAPLAEIVARRKDLFLEATCDETPWGMWLSFRRRIRPTAAYPQGRIVQGRFAMLAVNNHLCLFVSTLGRDAHNCGPHLLCKRSYPLAKRPFFPSRLLSRTITEMAAKNAWTAMATDAMGYDRSRRFRRDMREQPIEDAVAEMLAQERYVHRLEVTFVDESSAEVLRAAFDRYACVSVRRGPILPIVSQFISPAIRDAVSQEATYNVQLSAKSAHQHAVQLTFVNEPFRNRADMKALCDSMRKGEGLAVTIIHLNPYLQAQVIDMLSGRAADMIVMDRARVSLVPRSQDCDLALERMTTTLFRHFGEAQVAKVPVA